MDDARRPKINRRVTVTIIALALGFLAAGGILGVTSGKEIRKALKDQFNAEQIVIARNLAAFIEEKLDLLSPENILKRGFSISRQGGQVIRDAKDVDPDEVLVTELFKGKIYSHITGKQEKN